VVSIWKNQADPHTQLVKMSAKSAARIRASAVVMSALLLPPTAAAAQGKTPARQPSSISAKPTKAWIPPRTPWGEPDLQGVYTNTDELNIPMERPDRFVGRKLEDVAPEELADFARQSNEARRLNFEQNNAFRGLTAVDRFILNPSRAWLVVDPRDGKIPPLTVEGQERQATFTARLNQPADSAEALNLWYRCISLGVPRSMMPSIDGAPFRIVQAPGIVAIVYERMHEARVIHLESLQPIGQNIRKYMGAARGHWESSTLVVETSNFKGEFQMTSPASKGLRVVERFTPVAPRSVEWSVTFDDPSGWTRPWTFSMLLTQTREQLFEDACHEGNYVIRNILSAARAEEKTTEDAARERKQ
jgi:hypothetical protein